MTDQPSFGTVLAFNGRGDYLRIPDHPALRLSSYTISFWVRFAAKPSSASAFVFGGSKPGEGARPHHVCVGDVGSVRHRFSTDEQDDAGAPNTEPGSLDWGRWRHIAVTNDTKVARSFIDGELASEAEVVGAVIACDFDHYLGFNPDAPDHFIRAEFAELRVFSSARAPEQIRRTLNSRLTGAEQDLVLYLPLDEATPRDRSPHAHVIEIHGDPCARFVDDLPIADARLDLQHPVLALDGRASRLLIGALPELDAACTIELWTKLERVPSQPACLLEAIDSTGKGLAAIVLPLRGELAWIAGRGPTERLTRAAEPYAHAGAWTHWAFTKDASSGHMTIVRNGVIWAEGNDKSEALAGRITQLSLGAAGPGGAASKAWPGQVSELRIWSTARTPEQIRATLHVRLHGDEPGLVGYWPLDAEHGELAEDRSEAGRDGRVEQPTWVHSLLPVIAAEHDHSPATGFGDYAYWWHWQAHLVPEDSEKVPFRRGRIWS